MRRHRFHAFVTAALSFAFVATPFAPTRAATATAVGTLPAAMRTRIRAVIARDLAAYGGKTPVPGVLFGVWTPGRGSMVEGIGRARLAPARPLSLADHVRVGSNTKTFVVTALLQLVDEKKLALDDPISRFALPVRVKDGAHITVRELMAMRSGIFEVYALPELQRAGVKPNVAVDRVKLTQEACDEPRLFAPGTKWFYSNTNYLLLGMIVEAVTHERLERVLAERLFVPLHLARTSFPTTDPAMPQPYAHGYELVDGRWEDRTELFPPSLTWAAGVMVSDVADMKRWVEAYVTGTTNGAATQRARLACGATTEPGLRFGLGIGCSAGWYGYTGGLAGYNTAAYYLPAERTTIVAFVTSQIDEPTPGVANAIFRDVARIVTPAHVPYAVTTRSTRCSHAKVAGVRSPECETK